MQNIVTSRSYIHKTKGFENQ